MMKGTKAVAGMNIKRLVFGICVAFVLLCAFMGVSVASAKTIYVPDDYARIQWAVDNANAGDTIIVRDGTYVENIDINKPHLTIKSENGSAKCVVRAANSDDDVFYVTADNVTIKGFTVTGATGYTYGICLLSSSNSIIANNVISWNHCGIELWHSSNNTIANNTVSNNEWYGIHLHDSSNNTIANNIVSNNYYGIHLHDSSNNTIANNTVSSNYDDGIFLEESSNNIIANNTVSNNFDGIHLRYSSNNIIYFNNFINKDNIGYSYLSTNIWNSTEKITYTYNGKQHTNYLGNYWSDYKGSDADGDGIGDTPYSIYGDKDNYPLMERFENYFGGVEEYNPKLTVPDIAPLQESGYVGTTFQFVFNVTNKGTADDIIELSATDTASWHLELSKTSIALSPEESERVYLNVTAKDIGNDIITVKAASKNDETKFDELQFEVDTTYFNPLMIKMWTSKALEHQIEINAPKNVKYNITYSTPATYTLFF